MNDSTMSGDRTPHRPAPVTTHDAQFTFTPCTRLSRMTIDSQTNNSGRIRPTFLQRPATNFTQRLMKVVREEESHPNLDMLIGEDKISIFDRKSNTRRISFSSEDESDGGDLFSSSLCPVSPENVLNRRSIFDDDVMDTLTVRPRALVFDNNDIGDYLDDEEDTMDCYYDSTLSWLDSIHEGMDSHIIMEEEFGMGRDNNQENIAPMWYNRPKKDTYGQHLIRQQREPLVEIRVDDYLSDDEIHTKKKVAINNGQSRKIKVMRSLSPPRFSKRKGVN
ncbi:hypothetical protein BDB01DRAFT_784621 [Pilobolus umbonatus]|nr:hypothetical protein BDB01DRAFT_784621 [Pilobolus umbonatus]